MVSEAKVDPVDVEQESAGSAVEVKTTTTRKEENQEKIELTQPLHQNYKTEDIHQFRQDAKAMQLKHEDEAKDVVREMGEYSVDEK